MAFKFGDRIKETTTTVGTGTISLLGASPNYGAFSSILANADTTGYAISTDTGAEWEVGIGTWSTGGALSRTTVLSSSNAGALVTFSSGIKDVFCTYPAALSVYTNGKGSILCGLVNNNIAIGTSALATGITASTSSSSIGIGPSALAALTTGNRNIAIGSNSGKSILTNGGSVLLGCDAGFTMDAGGNTAIGDSALYACTTGGINTCLGYSAGYSITTGTYNICIGQTGSGTITTGSGNTIIGNLSGLGAGIANTIYIGTNSTPRIVFDGIMWNLIGGQKKTVALATSAVSTTLTAANIIANNIFQATGTTNTFTFPTGTLLSTALTNATGATVTVGDTIDVFFSNAGTGALTLAGGTGVTLANVMTIATLQSRLCKIRNTGTNTWIVY